MAEIEVVKYPNDILRKVAEPIEAGDTQTLEFLREMSNYIEDASKHASGLSLPQVGLSLRGFVFMLDGRAETVINPKIKRVSVNKMMLNEGCLSIDGVNARIPRPMKIEVEYLDENFSPKKRKLTGIDSIVFQHEIDHLNGILIIDHIK
jgi:peptide deformylase